MVRDPRKVGQPRVSSKSLIATGTPSSGDSGAPFSQRSSEACAWSKLVPSSIRQKELTFPSSFLTRERSAAATSTGEISLAAKAADNCGAFQCQGSDISVQPCLK